MQVNLHCGTSFFMIAENLILFWQLTLQLSFQSIAVSREDWYWPKTESNDEEDVQNEEELEENVDLTVSITFVFAV